METQMRIEKLQESDTYGKFVVEPLERGYGVTLGNSLRRVMLSSIPGAAVTTVKVDKVLHEFSTIPGVKEDTTELLLNLKELFVRVEPDTLDGSEPVTLRISRRGEGQVTGADVECPPGVSVVNPEVYLATIADENADLGIEMTVEMGKGYVLPDRQERRTEQPIGVIPVGAAFTPVRKVNFTVEPTRVGFRTDYERLVLDITTNGTITPSQAVSQSALVLDTILQRFVGFAGMVPATPEDLLPLDGITGVQAPDARIEELDFSVRTYNCLKKANILTISELVQTTEQDLMQIRNFGKKSLVEVRGKLADLGYTLKGGSTVPTEGIDDDGGEADDEI